MAGLRIEDAESLAKLTPSSLPGVAFIAFPDPQRSVGHAPQSHWHRLAMTDPAADITRAQ
jgi:hypothetical protein